MRKSISTAFQAFLLLFCLGCGEEDASIANDVHVPDTMDTATSTDVPDVVPPASNGPSHYFMAIHCDPKVEFPGDFIRLDEMVSAANERNLKLTLMLTPQWVPAIADNPTRKAKFDSWVAGGHEMALHHHSVYHPGTWDQYTDFAFDEYLPIMGAQKAELHEKLGDLNDLVNILDGLQPDMDSGCSSGERDKSVMPDTIVKDSCPGFSNSYAHPIGTRMDGIDPLKGVNDFVLKGITTDGIERRWLNHGMISAPFIEQTTEAFHDMDGGVHGIIVHTNVEDVAGLTAWMTMLVEYDGGEGTTTLSDAMEGEFLPEEMIESDVLNQIYDTINKDEGPPGA